MATRGKLLQTNIKLLRFLNMWPQEGKTDSLLVQTLKDISGLINVIIGLLTMTADLSIQMAGYYDDWMDITEDLTGIGALLGPIYMGICFIQNRKTLKKLIEDLEVFEEFGSAQKMLETEKKSSVITKILIVYGVIGNLIYTAVPYTNLSACKEKRANYKYYKDMPCELITRFRLPFHYEHNWWAVQAAVFWAATACLNTTIIMLSITMFVVAMLMQVIAQLQQLNIYIRNDMPVRDCIRYHIAIIDYASKMSKAFSSTMLMYITLTSFELSVLGFEVLMVNTISTSVRYSLHLLGWLTILYMVCKYGQQLIDESKAVGWEVYSIPWYNKSVSEQKDLSLMIMRSRRPLMLTAASMGTLSLEAFLNVLSAAYSYFTLLLNMKDD